MPKIPERVRQAVIERAKGFCEYCRAESRIIIFMEVDHVRPRSQGGTPTEENLALACPGCNDSKNKYEIGIDPETEQEHSLYNPRIQSWSEHFRWNDNMTLIIGQTPVGRATIDRLNMNREEMITARPLWRKIGWNPPTT